MSKVTEIKKVLRKIAVVTEDQMESTEIVTAQPLSDTLEVLGLKATEVKIKNLSEKGSVPHIEPRRAYEFYPLETLARQLDLDIYIEFYEVGNLPVYFVHEPPVTDLTKRLYIYLKTRIGEGGLSGSDASSIIKMVSDISEDFGLDPRLVLADQEVKAAIYYVWRDILNYGPLEIPMEDPDVEEVSWFAFDGPVLVVDREIANIYPYSEFVFTNILIPSSVGDDVKRKFIMAQVVRSITSKARVGLTVAKPIAEGRIPDPSGRGFHRLAAHLDITSRSPAVTIRKFPQVKYSLVKLIKSNNLTPFEAAYLLYQLVNRGFVLIVGGMASGKSVANELLLVKKKGGNINLTTFRDLWESLASKKKPQEINGIEFIDLSDEDIEILSLTSKGLNWVKPKYLIRHRFKDKLVKIRTRTGREISVTKDHSLLVWYVDESGIYIKKELPERIEAKKTYLPYIRNLSLEQKKDGSVKDGLKAFESMFVEPEVGFSNFIKYVIWNRNEEWRVGYLAGWIIRFGRIASNKYIEIELDPNLLGNNTHSKFYSTGLLYALSSIGVRAYIRREQDEKTGKTRQYIVIPIGDNKDTYLIKFLTSLNTEISGKIKEILSAGVEYDDVDVLPKEFASFFDELKEYNTDIPFSIIQEKYQEIFKLFPSNIGFDRVESVEEYEYDGYVYDIEVPETENFEANGILVHNTTLLQALISALPATFKVITVEDTPELSTPAANWHPLYVRRAKKETELEDIDFSTLVIHSLRHRGTVVTLGEVRGKEMATLIQAAASGHGAICTFHAQDPKTVLARITSPPINVAPESLLLISSIVNIALTSTEKYGGTKRVRRVRRIFEILDVHGRRVNSVEVFRWDPIEDMHMPDLTFKDFKKDVDALLTLWKSSRVIRSIGSVLYGREEYRVLADIYVLALFLKRAMDRELEDIKTLSREITAFYLSIMPEASKRIAPKIGEYFKQEIKEVSQ